MKRKIYKILTGAKQALFTLALFALSGTICSQTTYTFNYTGATQTISLPAGNYSIECWGADGGSGNNGSNTILGGKGGYARGVFTNTSSAIFNVYVGGHGGNASGAAQVGGGGGGMSDIAPASNTTIIIIAAGGGGGGTSGGTTSENSTGGDGGGLTGGTAQDGSGVSGGTSATGGSQTTGGAATAGSYGAGTPGGYGYGGGAANTGTAGVMHGAGGAGGNGGNGGWNGGGGGSTLTGINDHSGGGGAGYYGGGGGRGDGGAGGGGSSYISGLTNAATIMSGQTGFVTNPDVTGNGRVMITELCSISLMTSSSGTANPATICAGTTLTITTNAISNYSWSTGATTNSIVVSPTTNTLYSLSAVSPSNCTASANLNVIVSSGVPVLTLAATPASVCVGDSLMLNATGAISYTWSNGVNNNELFPPAQTSTYVVTGENGCGTTTAAITVTALPLPVTILSTTNTTCSGSPLTLTVTGGSTYTWSTNQTASVIIVAPTSQTTYTVLGKSGNCENTNSITISTNPLPNVQLAGTSTNVCAGTTVTLTASGGSSYTWTPSTLSGTVVTDIPALSFNYQVTGSNGFGCVSSANHLVIVNPLPTITVNSSQPIICPGASVALTAAGGHTYSWSTAAQTKSISVYPSSTTQYTVTGTFTNTGCSDETSFTVNVDQPVLSVSPSQTVCPGTLVTMTVNGSQPSWSNGGTNLFNSVTVTTPTMYTVSAKVVTPNNLLCEATGTVTLGMHPKPVVAATATRSEICTKEKTILTASGADTYLWLNNNHTGAALTFSATQVMTHTYTQVMTHTYTVIGTDANGCKDTAKVSVKVSACTGLAESDQSGISIYPNPSTGRFTVKSEYDVVLHVSNELGQLLRVIELNGQNQYQVQVSDLPRGIYFIKGEIGNGRINHKLIVE
jgi:hypothetical protein